MKTFKNFALQSDSVIYSLYCKDCLICQPVRDIKAPGSEKKKTQFTHLKSQARKPSERELASCLPL